MGTQIQRLRYFDGEYLRGADFEAEQAYHLEMRRRLNMALHLYGIVSGLELVANNDAGIPQVSVNPGMAIDAYGREIFVFATYAFGDDDIRVNRIDRTGTGTYDVWIRYQRNSNTLPPGGFASCNGNGGGQYTRWQESYKILLLKQDAPAPANPQVTDPESDDPETDLISVRLGSVVVDPTALTFTNPQPTNRVYVGLRAQRLAAPQFVTTPPPPFDILSGSAPLTPPVSIEALDNVFADQNLIIGSNFQVNPKPSPPAGQLLPTTSAGNLKIASDLFLNGNFYARSGPKWLGLADYFKQFIPDIKSDVKTVTIPSPSTADQATGSLATFTVTSSLQNVSSAQLFCSITGVKFNTDDVIAQITTKLGVPNAPIVYSILGVPAATQSSNVYNVTLKWTVGPTASVNPGPNFFASAIVELDVAYMVIFFP